VQTVSSRTACWAALVFCMVIALTTCQRLALGDETPAKETKKLSGRLPAYFADVVSEKQRQRIYQIQASYKPRIESIEQQLKELKKHRDEDIAGVLTPEQKQRVEEAALKAKAKRAKAE
jgi:hypothetical protein